MIARMTTPASKTAAGSVGTVETQFLDLPQPLRARLWTRAASDPHRLRDLRDAVAGARQRHPGLPRAERRRPRGRLHDDAGRGEHQGRLPRRRARRRQRPGPGLVGRHDRSRQGVRHRPVLRRQLESSRRLPRHDRTVVHESGDGPALRIRLSGHHGRGHGAGRARAPERARDHAAGRRRRRLARRHAGARVGGAVRRSGRCDHSDREHARAPPAGRRLECDRAQRHHRRSGLAGRPLLRHGPRADGGHGRRPHGRTHHVSVRHVAQRQVRQAPAVRGRHSLPPHGARVRSRELPAPPGGHAS